MALSLEVRVFLDAEAAYCCDVRSCLFFDAEVADFRVVVLDTEFRAVRSLDIRFFFDAERTVRSLNVRLFFFDLAALDRNEKRRSLRAMLGLSSLEACVED